MNFTLSAASDLCFPWTGVSGTFNSWLHASDPPAAISSNGDGSFDKLLKELELKICGCASAPDVLTLRAGSSSGISCSDLSQREADSVARSSNTSFWKNADMPSWLVLTECDAELVALGLCPWPGCVELTCAIP